MIINQNALMMAIRPFVVLCLNLHHMHSSYQIPHSPCNALVYRSLLLARSELLSRLPGNLASNSAQGLQRPISQLDRAELDHARIQAQRLPHVVLDLARGVVPHDEVVTVGVEGLVLARALGQTPHAPVADAADRAAVLEDEGARRARDPVWVSCFSSVLVARWMWMEGERDWRRCFLTL